MIQSIALLKNNFKTNLSSLYSLNEINSLWKKWVISEILKISLEEYYISDYTLDASDCNQINNLIAHLSENQPVQYFFGYTYFKQLKIYINPNVLIPRPETESLVDIIIKNINIQQRYNILDIGTGSGCISIALKKHINGNILAIDINDKILNVAKKNAKLNNVLVHFQIMNILSNNDYSLSHKFDLIVSNPPYVLESEVSSTSNIHYEPSTAIFVDTESPLLFYDRILMFSIHNLNVGGKIFFEINPIFIEPLISLIKSYNYINIEIFNDFYEKKRFIIVNS